MPTAYVNIGSNIGNRRSMLERAVACIMRRWKGVRVSSIVESEPWGYDSSNMFLNQGVAFECSEGDTSVSVHNELQHIQNEICAASHRTAEGRYADRAIDIDLIAIDDFLVDSPELQLPHPRMHLREFVLRPMLELAPDWVHPYSGKKVTQMLAELTK